MLPMIFVATGALLMKLRKHALESNECYDFDEKERAASLRTCCSNSALNRMGEGGEAGGGERCGGGAEGALSELSGKEKQLGEMEMPLSCKFCDEDACCRFCFGGPDKGDLIAPCACVGSQEFVHTKCLQQWQKIAMRTKGNRETYCRVCHGKYRLPSKPVKLRAKLWFSFKAKDRLNAYSRVWFQSLFQIFVAHKKSIAPVQMLARSSSAQELAIMLASTEVRIWAGREVRHGKTGLCVVKTMAWFGSAVNILAKLKAVGAF